MCAPEGGYVSCLHWPLFIRQLQQQTGQESPGRGRGGRSASERMDFLLFCMFNIEVPVPWEIMAFEYAHNLWIVPTKL